MNLRHTARFGSQSRLVWPAPGILVGLILLGTFLSSCAAERQNLKLAKHAVDQFHSQLDSEQYSAVYQGASAKMKAATNEADFVKLLENVHQRLGAVQESVLRGTTFELAHGAIRLSYVTTFARGVGREQFEWHIDDNQAVLYNYRISSSDLTKK